MGSGFVGTSRGMGRSGLAVIGAMALCAALVATASPAAAATVIHVDVAAVGADDGSSWADAFTDLQEALAEASPGDEIRVARGTYRPAASDRTVSFALVDGVRLIGGYSTGGTAGPDPELYETVLSGDLAGDDLPGFVDNAENSHHVVTADGVGPDTVVDGFTITAGNAAGSGLGHGGGISTTNGASPSFVDTVVSHNWAIEGGGVHNGFSSPSFTDVVITDNFAWYGGGMYNAGSSPLIVGSSVSANEAGSQGGGVFNAGSGSPAIVRSTVSHNTAPNAGGGIYNSGSSLSTSIVNTVISHNSGSTGGGIAIEAQAPTSIVNSVISSNTGGAVRNWFSPTTSIVNTVVADNHRDGGGHGIVNTGAGISVVNSIVWANGSPSSPGIVDEPGYPPSQVHHSDVQNWTGAGIGNLDVNPLFVSAGDYRLRALSPAREAGDNAATEVDVFDVDRDLDVTEPTPDLDLNPRIHGTVDMGAYEGLETPSITPYGFVVRAEGDSGSTTYDLPVYLSDPSAVPVTVEWATVDTNAAPLAEAGTDFVAGSGTVTFAPGETVQTVRIEILGDRDDEPPLLWGEWGLVAFSDPTNAVLDTATFFGHGLFIIIDDDP